MKVRRATIEDLHMLIEFTSAEAGEAEGRTVHADRLEQGIRAALEDESLAMYWILFDDAGRAVGSVSTIREWSDWNAGFYWWIQSMYLVPEQRGRGCMQRLLDAVEAEMKARGGLELRLYVHRENVAAVKAYQKAAFECSPYEIMVRRK